MGMERKIGELDEESSILQRLAPEKGGIGE